MADSDLWKNQVANRSELLVECGFVKGLYDNGKINSALMEQFFAKSDSGAVILKEGATAKSLIKDKLLSPEEEEAEIIKEQFGPTGFPKPAKVYRIAWEVYDLSLEEPYFWIVDTLKENFPILEKIEDSFSASENSAFFGVTQMRLGAQQDKATQFLATVGKMIKDLFQIIRELRIIDERLKYYDEAETQLSKPLSERSKASEVTLKGLFVDLVQGGGKNPASIYGMARELEFITLPDLFFDAPPFGSTEELDTHLKSLEKDFNKNVLRVLQRHLRQYVEWKKRTHQELRTRRGFMINYVWQHYEVVKMYINWIKPYLRHTAKLTMKEKNVPELITAFEGSMLDIEILARKREGKANGCVLATFNYRTRPELKVVQEGYQRGPVHIGKMEATLRVYAWTDSQVESYKYLKDRETMILMGEISGSVMQAMESLGDDLKRYVDEARGLKEKAKKSAGFSAPKKSFMEKYFGDFYTPAVLKPKTGKVPSGKELREEQKKLEKALAGVLGHAKFHCWNTYNNFKKSRAMIAW